MDLKNIKIETIQTQKDKISHVLCHMCVLGWKGQINVCLLQVFIEAKELQRSL